MRLKFVQATTPTFKQPSHAENRQAVLSKVFQQNHSLLGNISENGSVKSYIKIFQTVAEKTAKNFMGLLYSAAICILYIHDELGLEDPDFHM